MEEGKEVGEGKELNTCRRATYLIRVGSRRTVVTCISKTVAIFVCLFSVWNQWTVIKDIS